MYAKGTEFEASIEKISGQKFPDIIAEKYFGVEVKTSKNKDWKSTGNSVLENSRVDGIEKIYLFFGKLSNPVDFRYRKYEECLYEVAVTHSPRYLINMDLKPNATIFDKIGIQYNTLRKMDKPISPIVNYYKSKLKEGEELWWMGDEKTSSLSIKQWSNISPDEKMNIRIEAFILFPELLGDSSKKYMQFSIWLFTECGIVCTSIRDIFTAGGQVNITLNGTQFKLPKIYKHLIDNLVEIKRLLLIKPVEELEQYWPQDNITDQKKMTTWSKLIIQHSSLNIAAKEQLSHVLRMFFTDNDPHALP